MPTFVSRRGFVVTASSLGLLGAGVYLARGDDGPAMDPEAFPRYGPQVVKDIVTWSHFNLSGVRDLVERQPALARATIDWGFGDVESCLDAAAHTGRREIAELLLAHGARATIFSAAMLGQLDVVKACVAARPGMQRSHGPHSITLLAHAKSGGADAEPVVRYLTALGDADLPPLPIVALSPAERDGLVGRYVFGTGPRDHFDVDVERDRLGINRPGAPARRLLTHVGQLTFYPAGAPSVKIAFAREGGKAQMTIADPTVFLTASRTAAG